MLLPYCVGFYCGYWCVQGFKLKAEAAATVLCVCIHFFLTSTASSLVSHYFASFNCVRVLLAISRLLSSPHAVVKSRGFISPASRHTLEPAARHIVNAARSALCSFKSSNVTYLHTYRFLRFYARISRSNLYVLHVLKLLTLQISNVFCWYSV